MACNKTLPRAMAASMPVRTLGELVKEYDTRLWRILDHCVHKAREQLDLSDVKQVGVEETSSKRGHNYVSLFVDLETPKVVFATEGKDASTLEAFRDDLAAHQGDAAEIEEVWADMSLKPISPEPKSPLTNSTCSKSSMKPWIRFALRSSSTALSLTKHDISG